MLSLQEKVNRLESIGITWMGPEEKYFLRDQYVDLPDIEPMTDDQFEDLTQQIIPMVPTVIDKALEEFKSGSQILRDHEARASRALFLGGKLLDAWIAADGIADPVKRFERYGVLDKSSNTYLVNCRDAVREMKEARAIISQLMERILTKYTTEENSIDLQAKVINAPKKIQDRRNRYVTDRIQEDKRVKAEAEKKAQKAKEDVDVRAAIKGQIGTALISYQTKIKNSWLGSFNTITLDNIDAKTEGLNNLPTAFPSKQLETIVAVVFPVTFHHTVEEKEAIKAEEWAAYDFFGFYLTFGQDMSDYKKELQDKLPSKKEELLEAKRIADQAEQDRLAQIEKNRVAEEKRQEALKAQKDEQAKEALRKKQEKDRQDEQDRLAKIESDRVQAEKDLEEQKKQRELQEQLDLQKEEAKKQQQNNSQVELGRVSGHASTLFNMQNEISSSGPLPSAREGFEIDVHNMVGWVEIFTRWVDSNGAELALDKWEKKTLGSMKKDLETVAAKAQKAGKIDQIVSKNLTYRETAKATNLKEKEEKGAK